VTQPDRPEPDRPEPDRPGRVEHRLERTYTVPATPERVWAAIATAEGITSWMAPTRLDPRVGGEVEFDLGDLTSTGVVTDYTPGVRFAYEEPWPVLGPDGAVVPAMASWFADRGVPLSQVRDDLAAATPLATEFLVEAESGGSCVIRVVTSAYGSGADWEHEFFDEMVGGFVPLLDALAAHLSTAAG
jgi:uncharacterized protein YndB with AHSA1/START domain